MPNQKDIKALISLNELSIYHNELKDLIPKSITESTISDWGFTKNTGNYNKPSTGIPKSDLASDIQTSLGKADTACAGNDSRLSNARPASDVYAWAKASTKPTYTASEVGALPSSAISVSGDTLFLDF